ncbi:MAG: primosomal protein N' [Legionellaceae bacterium]|nr:primosomal protein N' [Legionellaceae bacterium]
MVVYKVSVLHTNRDCFDYIAKDLEPCIGGRVWVPFRNQTKLGVVVGVGEPERANVSLKSIISILDATPILSDDMLALCRWVSTYYQSPLSEVFSLALPKKYRLGDDRQLPMCDYYALVLPCDEAHERVSPRAIRQHAVIDYIGSRSEPSSKKELSLAGFNSSQLRVLVDTDILVKHSWVEMPSRPVGIPSQPLPLNEEQHVAWNIISEALHSYHCFLLQGVTGSGKTEVYLQVIAKTLAMGRQVLVLVPEIGLTPQLLARFSSRFQEPMVVIHSNLNDTERQHAWQLAHDNYVKLVIGTRSAIFTPMPKLGLIVIDEEHDSSLKQMEGVRYSARDTALMRAHFANIPIILGSATPSLESLHNCALKKHTLLRLNQKALTSTPLHYQILDIRNQPMQHGLANPTLAMIGEHLQQGNQVLVFINRRGFSPVLLCHQCGWIADCHGCDTHLTLHRSANQLICHHCGLTKPMIIRCQSCKGQELLPVGAGTQRIHEYLSLQFPTTSILRVDRDEVSKKNAMNEHLNRIHAGDAQLIVGTQMLAKGHHFPRLTLVVVLDADNGFYNQDFRALERLGQLLTQVSGRAGRAEFPGQVVIQTHLPQHPMLNVLIQEGYESFAQTLLSSRQQASLPPYHFLAMLRAQGHNQEKLLSFMHAVKDQLITTGVHVLGPAPAPLARKAGQHRMQLMVKSPSRKVLSAALTPVRGWLLSNKLSTGLRWNIDVDPMDLS